VAGWLGSGPLWPIAIVFLAAPLIVVGYSAASRVNVDATTEVAALMVIAASTLAGTGRLAVASALAALMTASLWF
jgi:hypothetical protein